jgi:hypothetical protein
MARKPARINTWETVEMKDERKRQLTAKIRISRTRGFEQSREIKTAANAMSRNVKELRAMPSKKDGFSTDIAEGSTKPHRPEELHCLNLPTRMGMSQLAIAD